MLYIIYPLSHTTKDVTHINFPKYPFDNTNIAEMPR